MSIVGTPYEELVNMGQMQEADALAAIEQDRIASEAANTDVVEEGEKVGETTDADANPDDGAGDGDQKAVEDPYYKKHGYEDEDSLVKDLSEYKNLQSRVAALQAKETELNEKASVLTKYESPYSHDLIGRLDKAYEKLKIDDISVLGRIVNTTSESVSKDPIEAIVVAKVLEDPSVLSSGITFNDLLEMEREDYEKRGVDVEDKDSLAYKRLVMESGKALVKINTFQQELANVKGKYTFAHEEQAAARQKYSESVGVITPKVEELLGSGDRKFNVDGYDLSVKFSKEDLLDIAKMATETAAQRGIDVNTSEGVKALSDLVGAFAKGAAVRSGDYEKALVEAVRLKAKEDAIREASLGKPEKRGGGDAGSGAKKLTSGEELYDKLLRESR